MSKPRSAFSMEGNARLCRGLLVTRCGDTGTATLQVIAILRRAGNYFLVGYAICTSSPNSCTTPVWDRMREPWLGQHEADRSGDRGNHVPGHLPGR